MKTRIITAIVACALLLPVLLFSDSPLLPIMLSLCSVVAIYEIASCIGVKKDYWLTVPLYLFAAGLPFFVRYAADEELVTKVFLAICMVSALYFLSVLTFSHKKYQLADVAICFMTAFYILAGFNSIQMLRDYELGGKYVYLTVFIAAWITDIFAYFCGMLFGRGGKHKLLPDVSPKKTVEGSIGGIVFCILSMLIFGVVINLINESLNANYLLLAIGGLLASVVAQIGDLCMSVIKRTYGVKDYGKIFPGHGGVLDRFDSVLAVSIVLAALCSFFNFFQ